GDEPGDQLLEHADAEHFPPPGDLFVRMGDQQAEVASCELDARVATCDQLRVTLRALRAEGQDKTAQGVPGLGKMHKRELQELRRMKGIGFGQHTTVPELRQRLKGWKVEVAVSGASSNVAHPSSQITGSDKMSFGKYPTADYRWVLKNDLGYARRAVLELDNGRASPLLARFGRWVKAHGVRPLEPEELKAAIEAVMAEEVILDDESATLTATTQRASASHGSWTGHRRPRPVEEHEMDTGDRGFQKAGETDQDQPPASGRRPGIKKGKRVGLLYQVTGLLSAFAFQAVLTADWLSKPLKPFARHATSAARDVADHVRNVKDVYTVRIHGVGVMQVFGGEGGIAEAAARRNMTAAEEIDRKCGWDLRKQKDLEITHERCYASRPKFASIELPCTCCANIAHLNFRTPQGKQALRRLARGGVAMIENRAASRIWAQRIMIELLANNRAYQVRRDMCDYGARRYKAGGLIKHPAKLLVTREESERLRRTCSHTHRDQTFGDNVAARKSGVYPAKFCRAVVRVLAQIIRRQGGPRACQSSSPLIATELKEQATVYVNDAAPLGETGEPIGDPAPRGGGDDFADTHDVQTDETVDGRIGVGAITFTKKAAACCEPAELAMLKRLHVNLGHPSNEDLGCSLRFEGAKSAAVQAVEGLICGVHRSQQRPSARRPAHLHFVQDFGDDVGFDCFELKDVDGKSYLYFSIVDLATTFHVATLIGRHTSQDFATAFERCWASWAGVPDRVYFDMERGFGGVLSELFQSFDAVQLPIAGQAHWQLGRVELAARTIEHSSIRGEGEMRTLGIMVSGAKNSLRRRAGVSPAQWVLGRDPKMPADLADDTANYGAHSLATHDETICRRYAIRTAARESFMRMQNDDQLRRAMLAGARTVATPLSVGDMCYIFRQVKKKEQKEQHNRNAKKGHATLVAPEHIKALAPDDVWFPNGLGEIGQAVAELNRARDPLEQEEAPVEDIRPEPGQPEVQPDGMEQAWREFIDSPDDDDLRLNVPEDLKPQEQIEVLPADRADIPQSAFEEQPYGPVDFRRRRATFGERPSTGRTAATTAKEHAGSGGSPPRTASRNRAAVPESGAAARSEQEGARERSRSAPREAMQTSIVAERIKRKQADKESEAVRGRVKANLILPSRFVYRDRNAPLRTDKRPLPFEAKARLCVGGHVEPRLAQGDLRTDAPTVTRNSAMLFFTVCQWFDLEIYAADVEAAFMQGDEQPDQQLHMAQPREGLPGLRPKQLIKILKGVFGLHSLDPALYYGCDKHGGLCAVVVAHVDDLLLGVSGSTNSCRGATLCDWLYKLLPWGDWRGLPFTFCGKQARRDEEGALRLRQTDDANTIEEIALSQERKTELSAEATPAEFSDNRSALGALGWLSSQTRPDLSAGDLLETNRLIKLARKHADAGLEFTRLREPLCLVTYHDASWANADEPPEGVVATLLTKIVGSKDNHIKIRSQAGYVTFIAEAKLLRGDKARAGIVDWRSGTIRRVRRSIFGS
ncbi:unnamed protein product, partial [Prorocentrum cordatum]